MKMKLFKWEKGRLNQSNYSKMLLAKSNYFKFDFYLLKFQNTEIPWHFDKVENYKHFRINFIIKKPKSGGFTLFDNKVEKRRLYKFRPDIQKHSVNYVNGTMFMLSLGWLKK